MPSPLCISAIVPTLNEERHVERCLDALRGAGVAEIVIVDAGSSDRTLELARPLADRVFVETGGLFAQLNRGALEATGEVLLFQYADGRLPRDGTREICRVLEDGGLAGGAFRLSFDARAPWYGVVAFFAGVRNRLGFGPFGDQSLFVRAGVFRELGGFDVGDVLPDFGLVRRLRRRGAFRLLSLAVASSVRRWEENGRMRTLLAHWGVSARYLLGGRRTRSTARDGLEDLRRVRDRA